MSDRLKSTNNISNEEVIDDLTKNLQFSLRTEDQEGFVTKPSNSISDFEPPKGGTMPENQTDDRYSPSDDFDTDIDTKYEPAEDVSDDDSIDEVLLKDTEMDLTDDQKAEKQIIAEQLKVAGNDCFKNKEYERSKEKYSEALKICPLQFSQQRAVLYCNRGASKMKLQQYNAAIKDCSKAIELDNKYLKAYYRRAQSYEITEKLDESLEDFKKILELDPAHQEAACAMVRLPPLIEERNEKLKTEMFGKLKDLGNMFLKPFGLSTDNFKLEQDPESKGYKINFKQ